MSKISDQKLYDELIHFLAGRFEVDREAIHPETTLEEIGLNSSEMGAFTADLTAFLQEDLKAETTFPIGWGNVVVTLQDLFDLMKSGLSMALRRQA